MDGGDVNSFRIDQQDAEKCLYILFLFTFFNKVIASVDVQIFFRVECRLSQPLSTGYTLASRAESSQSAVNRRFAWHCSLHIQS